MLRSRLILCLSMLLVAVGLTACAKKPGEDTSAAPAAAVMTPVQRGEYLVTIAGCNDCHTPGTLYGAPDFKRALSGSELGWEGPLGVAFASNITPDMETGIGSWTDAEIERALRSGIKKDGSPIAPPMPWPSYARLTPEDMAAMIAYLRSIPAVPHKNPAKTPPGQTTKGGAVLRMPPPPAWDAPRPEAAAKH